MADIEHGTQPQEDLAQRIRNAAAAAGTHRIKGADQQEVDVPGAHEAIPQAPHSGEPVESVPPYMRRPNEETGKMIDSALTHERVARLIGADRHSSPAGLYEEVEPLDQNLGQENTDNTETAPTTQKPQIPTPPVVGEAEQAEHRSFYQRHKTLSRIVGAVAAVSAGTAIYATVEANSQAGKLLKNMNETSAPPQTPTTSTPPQLETSPTDGGNELQQSPQLLAQSFIESTFLDEPAKGYALTFSNFKRQITAEKWQQSIDNSYSVFTGHTPLKFLGESTDDITGAPNSLVRDATGTEGLPRLTESYSTKFNGGKATMTFQVMLVEDGNNWWVADLAENSTTQD